MKIKIEESGTSRLVQKFIDDDIQFAIISGCRPEVDNTAALAKDIRKLGYGYNQYIGRWVENGQIFDEYSFLVPNISFKQAFKLGQKYNQSSIIYKDKNGCKEYCTTPFETYEVGDIVRTYNINKKNPLNSRIAADIFSGKQEGPTSKMIKGSNPQAFNFQVENFSLSEKILINTRLGFTEEEIDLNDEII